jgi:TonB family protein
MIKLRHYRRGFLFLALAIVCAPGLAGAQEDVPQTDSLPIVSSKQARSLILVQSMPDYPPLAKVNYIQGHVSLEIRVNDHGKVANAHVLTGNAVLAASTLKATRRWIYHPLDTPYGPSGFMTRVEVKFVLQNEPAALTPRRAERDLLRQVKPPQVFRPVEFAPWARAVHLHLLVDDEGRVIDSEVSTRGKEMFEAALKIVQGWTIRPARWGALPIASYLDVDVPVRSPIALAAGNSGSR